MARNRAIGPCSSWNLDRRSNDLPQATTEEGLLRQFGSTPGGVATNEAAHHAGNKEAGGEELQALVVVLAVGVVALIMALHVGIDVRKEFLQKWAHGCDAPGDAIVESAGQAKW